MTFEIVRHAPHGVDLVSVNVFGANGEVVGGTDMLPDPAIYREAVEKMAKRFPVDVDEVLVALNG